MVFSSKPNPGLLATLMSVAFRSHHNEKHYDALILLLFCFLRIFWVRTIFTPWHAYAVDASARNLRFRFVVSGLLRHDSQTDG